MTNRSVSVTIPPELHRRLTTIAAEGILGRSVEEVIIHLMRNAIHRDWLVQPAAREKPTLPPALHLIPEKKPLPKEATPEEIYRARKRLLRLPEVCRQVGLGRSSIYSLVNLGSFPAPKRLGARTVAWLQSDVDDWIAAKFGVG
jgi:prophage regulatory protein